MKKIHLSPVLLVLIAVAGMTLYVFTREETGKNGRVNEPLPVVVEQVTQQPFAVVIEALGTAKANESVEVTALSTEMVDSIGFDDGDRVKKGQLLVSLHNREEKAKVNELEIGLQEAKRQLTRIRNLARENAASAQLLDEQEAKVKALTAQLEVVNAKLADLEIRAPFSGKLGIRRVSQGALVRPGEVITTLDDVHQMKVDFSISEVHLPDVQKGLKVQAHSVAYPDKVFEGEISSLDSRLDPITRSIQVRAIIDNPDFLLSPGMLLQINLHKRLLNTLVVSEGALIPIDDKQFVFVVDEQGMVKKTEVKVGYRKPGTAQIISGLNEGERVVIEGALRLGDGAKVKVVEG
ncbi:efflux RND transporter periplasmic adaptor subunit [Aliiglaciecola sp. CAU 1673]|uniref:efflux RND transporter periplasmic adaptor subunit n=1 Tax=Aliiglaciecola sp. CAU 1673 TaxID=3032595 RepID=UPI0023DB98D7|nr:efflux RND transporter periplasmic adaptor subunit [Aliiglaciecola sp. CAU 1673]MDF2180390.1 efflux RND transporter periplasmic adaptor subunit [Aliiglaciecola sp. CAU 1673]